MIGNSWIFLYKPHVLFAQVQVNPSLNVNSIETWIPVISAVSGSLITVVIGGVVVQLFWSLKAAEGRALQAEKDKEITRLEAKYDTEIKDKSLEIRATIEKYNDQIRDLTSEYQREIREKDFEILQLNSEIARLKLESPPSLKESYELLRSELIKINEQLTQQLQETQADLAKKEKQIQELAGTDENRLLLGELSLQKRELEIKHKIIQEYLESIRNFRRQMQAYQAAVTWIEANREELVNSSVAHVLQHHTSLLLNLSDLDKGGYIEKFKINVDDYIDWLRFSLKQGKGINLQKIDCKPEVPGFALAEAFKFIQRNRIVRELPDDIADQMGPFISDLIAYFSSSAFR
jgi:hypothetical protein